MLFSLFKKTTSAHTNNNTVYKYRLNKMYLKDKNVRYKFMNRLKHISGYPYLQLLQQNNHQASQSSAGRLTVKREWCECEAPRVQPPHPVIHMTKVHLKAPSWCRRRTESWSYFELKRQKFITDRNLTLYKHWDALTVISSADSHCRHFYHRMMQRVSMRLR